MIQLNLLWLTMAVSTVVPLLVGLITKSKASRTVKTITNLALAAVAAGITTALTTNGRVDLDHWLITIAIAFAASVLSHYHLWKPTGATDLISQILPNTGIGTQPLDLAGILKILNDMQGVTVEHVADDLAQLEQIVPLNTGGPVPAFGNITSETAPGTALPIGRIPFSGLQAGGGGEGGGLFGGGASAPDPSTRLAIRPNPGIPEKRGTKPPPPRSPLTPPA